jgi:hypothetical protein
MRIAHFMAKFGYAAVIRWMTLIASRDFFTRYKADRQAGGGGVILRPRIAITGAGCARLAKAGMLECAVQSRLQQDPRRGGEHIMRSLFHEQQEFLPSKASIYYL